MCWCGKVVWPRDCEYVGPEFAPLSLRTFFCPPMRWMMIQIPSMAIDGPSMPIGKSCDGHRWAIDGIEWSLSTGMSFELETI